MRANNLKDLSGETFGCLAVQTDSGERAQSGDVIWDCRCQCGAAARWRASRLRRLPKCWHAPSSNNPARRCWDAMIDRCHNLNSDNYPSYGMRGIVVYARWRASFWNFLEDMGARPSPRHTIDRWPDQAGNYEPGNCRWALPGQQNRNKRNNVYVEHNGERVLLVDVPRAPGVGRELALRRLKLGWPLERAISQPPHQYRRRTPECQPLTSTEN